MTLFQAAILGLVQGLSEFLPISSSAHLILVRTFFGWADPGLAFDVALHWGTLFGVFIYFWKEILDLMSGFISSLSGRRDYANRLPWHILIGTIPAGVLGLLLEHKAETLFRSPWIIAGTLSSVAVLIWAAEHLRKATAPLNHMTWKQAILIGASQGLAVVPGVSRSGISISLALFLGFDRVSAVLFSFLLSIPLILGAGITKIKVIILGLHDPILLVGIASSALSGYAAILFLMNHVKTKSFTPFVIYRLILAAIVIAWLLTHPSI